MRKVHTRLAGATALIVAATGLVLGGLSTGAQANCESIREIGINDVTAYEGSPSERTPSTLFVFSVTSDVCAQAGTLSYDVRADTTDERDLRYTSGRLVFTEGDLSEQRIVVEVSPDAVEEPTEMFRVVLHSVTGQVGLCRAFATGFIANDDGGKNPITLPTLMPPCELHKSR